MTEEDENYVQGLGVNLLMGVVGTFVVFTGLCVISLRNLDQAILCSSASTIFGGPYIGFLLAIRGAQARTRRSEVEAALRSEIDAGELEMGASVLDSLAPASAGPMIPLLTARAPARPQPSSTLTSQ